MNVPATQQDLAQYCPTPATPQTIKSKTDQMYKPFELTALMARRLPVHISKIPCHKRNDRNNLGGSDGEVDAWSGGMHDVDTC